MADGKEGRLGTRLGSPREVSSRSAPTSVGGSDKDGPGKPQIARSARCQ